jgi:hypothetical protein
MPYLLKLGPVPLEEGATNVYLRVGEGGEIASPVFGPSDEPALRELQGTDPPEGFRCEPAMAEAAAALGLGVEEPTLRVHQARAAIAVFMAWGQRGLAGMGSELALLMMQAVTEFWEAHPWVFWDDRQALDVTLSGDVERGYEGSVFGSSEQGFGLALYESRGAIKRLISLQEAGQAAEARRLPAIGVMLDDRPTYAVEALRTAGRVPRLPLPIKTGPTGPGVPRPEECLVLVAALRAVALLSPTLRDTQCEASAMGLRLLARVVAPPARVRH